MIKIDIGCGENKKKGYIGIDKYKGREVDYIIDLEKEKLPFENDSVDAIYCSHTLEHINNIFWLMEECYRILKPQSKFHIIVPYFRSRIAFQDPAHVRFFTEATFKKYFGSNYLSQYYNNQRKCNFEQTFLMIRGQNFDNLIMEVYLKAIK